MRLLTVACLAIVTFVACQGDIHQRIVTTDDQTGVSKDVRNSTVLTDGDKAAFFEAFSHSGYQPYGKTVSQIISDQQSHDKAVATEQAQLKRELDNDIEIHPVSISVARGTIGSGQFQADAPFKDVDTFVFSVQNNGAKDIKYFDADAKLTNQGGATIFSGDIEDAGGIAAHQSKEITITLSGNDFQHLPTGTETVRATEVSQTVVNYTVNRIDFSDGSKADRSNLETE